MRYTFCAIVRADHERSRRHTMHESACAELLIRSASTVSNATERSSVLNAHPHLTRTTSVSTDMT